MTGVDSAEFQRLTAPHRRALQAHCYRMMGSLSDAEDVLQETLIRAWKSFATFEGRSSLRSWLYRIATNASLDALERRPARTVPERRTAALGLGEMPGAPLTEPIWMEPYPDELLPADTGEDAGPEVRMTSRESVALAFLAALQLLPPRQRAILLLRDVLGWQATEVAELLEASVASVTSALQRARATLEEEGAAPSSVRPPDDEGTRVLLGRYVRAWESADVPALVALLKEDAAFTMPPFEAWYVGRAAIGAFLSATILRGDARGRYRLVPTAANGQFAFAFYERRADGTYGANSVQVVTLEGGAITAVASFLDPGLPVRFGLSAEL